MKGRLLVVISLAALALAGCNRAQRPKPLPGQETRVANLLEGCAMGLERFLPGDYYYCQAGSHFWAARFGMARESLESAARWGSKPAQHALGVMYFNGDHAPMNRPLGVVWLALAAERHAPIFESIFVSAYKTLSPAELDQANVYWREMKPVYGDAFAAARAKRRYDREMYKFEMAAAFSSEVYVSGVAGPSESLTPVQRLRNEGSNYFVGYQTHVWVGDAELIPLGQVPGTNQPATPSTPSTPAN